MKNWCIDPSQGVHNREAGPLLPPKGGRRPPSFMKESVCLIFPADEKGNRLFLLQASDAED